MRQLSDEELFGDEEALAPCKQCGSSLVGFFVPDENPYQVFCMCLECNNRGKSMSADCFDDGIDYQCIGAAEAAALMWNDENE